MRFSIHINQKQAISLGLTNINQAIILDYLVHQTNWAETVIVDEKAYKWVARQVICKQLPIIDIQEKTAYRHLKALHELGFIEYIKDGKKDLIRVLKKAQKYYVDSEIPLEQKQESKIPKTGFENPKNGNLKSTYKTSKDKTNNNTYSENRDLDIENRFAITPEWIPSNQIESISRLVLPDYKTYHSQQTLNEFIAYWMGRPSEFSDYEWHRKYLAHLKHQKATGSSKQESQGKTEKQYKGRTLREWSALATDKGIEGFKGWAEETPDHFVARVEGAL